MAATKKALKGASASIDPTSIMTPEMKAALTRKSKLEPLHRQAVARHQAAKDEADQGRDKKRHWLTMLSANA